MIRREEYQEVKRNEDWSIGNEPVIDFGAGLTKSISQYPDMKKAYDNFSEIYKIPKTNFILTNGCEEALRIACSVLERTSSSSDIFFYYENPSWGMVPVIGKQVFEYTVPINYSYNERPNGGFFKLDKIKYHTSDSVVYVTDRFSNLFEHRNMFNRDEHNRLIVDETYTGSMLCRFKDYNVEAEVNNILTEDCVYIGSYSKFFGCGIRLGYVLFNKKYNDLMQLYRPQYISPMACTFTGIHLYDMDKLVNDISKDADERYVTVHPNYCTIKAKDYNGPEERINKKFTVSGIEFYRLGVPLRDEDED